MAGDNRTHLGVVCRVLLALATLVAGSAAAHAATLSHISSVTIPSSVTANTVLGPQSVEIDASIGYTTSARLTIEVDIAGANFVTLNSPALSGMTCSSVTALTTKLIFEGCSVSAQGTTAFQLSGLSYTSAQGLTSGTSIALSGSIYNYANTSQVFETIASTTVVTAPAVNYTLTTNTSGTGAGTVTASPSAASYASGTAVTLTATPATGSTFGGWSGGGCSGTATTCQVTMNANQTVTATFTLASTYTLTVSYAGAGKGLVVASPNTTTYAPGTVVTLTATAFSGSTFGGWSGGGCSGTATTCQVTMNSNQTVTATYTLANTYTLTVSYAGSGQGVVVASPNSVTYSPGAVVTLTASAFSGSTFGGWSGGGCSGTATSCQVTMNSNQTVTATYTLATASTGLLRQAAVFSSASPSSQSFLRFYNAGATAGTVTVTLYDYTSGQQLGQWVSPSIAAGTAPQYPISTVEAGLTNSGAKSAFYSVTMQAQFAGTFQHVLWKPTDGTLTNLSTCDSGITAIQTRVTNVHSSLLGSAGYPSSIVIYNTGTSATSVPLIISDAATGASLGTYSTSTIPPNGEQILTVAAIEAAAGITPKSSIPHYVITVNSTSFTGYLQHLVNNTQVGVITDMTTVCSFPSTTSQTPTPVNPSAAAAPS